jgi:hypothetical protein
VLIYVAAQRAAHSVIFCSCQASFSESLAIFAKQMELNPDDIKSVWLAMKLPSSNSNKVSRQKTFFRRNLSKIMAPGSEQTWKSFASQVRERRSFPSKKSSITYSSFISMTSFLPKKCVILYAAFISPTGEVTGYGVEAIVDIPPRCVISKYDGKHLLSKGASKSVETKEFDSHKCNLLGSGHVICGYGADSALQILTDPNMPIASFCNHKAKTSNCCLVVVETLNDCYLVSRKPIFKGECLTVDYGDMSYHITEGGPPLTPAQSRARKETDNGKRSSQRLNEAAINTACTKKAKQMELNPVIY